MLSIGMFSSVCIGLPLLHDERPRSQLSGERMLKTIKKYVTHAVKTVRHAARKIGEKRSSAWPAVEKSFLQHNPYCKACGGQLKLNVHHKEPFHLFPEKELDPKNLITLCMAVDRHCHLNIGHGNDFKSYNPHVEKDASEAMALRRRGDIGGLKDLEAHVKKNRKTA